MKSNSSRFLHITSSYSGSTRISSWKKFATWFDLDHRVKPDGDREGEDASPKTECDKEEVNCDFTSECDRKLCRKRLKYDFIAKILSKSWF